MADEKKLNTAELAGIVLIAVILLFFPYLMINEHAHDVIANSYYHNGR
jgi:hypothetical protein